MLPYSLKLAWFCLSLLGLVQCWVILLVVFARKLGARWIWWTYLLGATILEGMFCLGLIWHMDPERMPRPFCIAQTLAFGLGSFILTGVCSSFALATSMAVLRPFSAQKPKTSNTVLAWHPRYIPLVIVFPVAACALQTTLTFIYNDVQPWIVDDMHCDATNPLWMRLFGYAGPPQIMTLPFLILSIYTAYRLHKIQERIDNLVLDASSNNTNLTSHPLRASRRRQREEYRLTTSSPAVKPVGGTEYAADGLKPQSQNWSRYSAFLPYPSKSAADRKAPGNGPDVVEYPLPKYPCTTYDPKTGLPVPMTGSASAENCGLSVPSITSRGSPASSLMPTFAPNPSLSTLPAEGSEATHEDVPTWFAITTDEDDRTQRSTSAFENSGADDGERSYTNFPVGMALTTDEPDRATSRTQTPVSLHNNPNRTFPNSDPLNSPDAGVEYEPFSPHSATSPLTRHVSNPSMSSTPTVHTRRVHAWEGIIPVSAITDDFPFSPPSAGTQSPWTSKDGTTTNGTLFRSEAYGRQPGSPVPYDETRFDHEMYVRRLEYSSDLKTSRATKGLRTELEHEEEEDEEEEEKLRTSYQFSSRRTVPSRDPRAREKNITSSSNNQGLDPVYQRQFRGALWRMVTFQIVFFIVQLLAGLSPLLNVLDNKVTPFGTQHVALILAPWGPIFIFGPAPSLRGTWRGRRRQIR